MENPTQLAQRFREVILNGKWIANTNYKALIDDLTWQEATRKTGSLNTIAALVFHINYYIGGVLNVFEGGKLEIRDKYSFDMPEIASEADWSKLKTSLFENSEKFAHHVEQMTEEKLSSPFVDVKYGDYRRNIEGMIEHAYYHMGQVSLLRKIEEIEKIVD